jgi:ABC-2 type transport system permease protein
MHKLLKIAKMEFRRTVMNTVFVILTVLGPFIIFSVAVLPGFLASAGVFRNTDTPKIAVFGADKEIFDAMKASLIQENISLVETAGENIDGYLIIPEDPAVETLEYVSQNMTDFRLRDILEATVNRAIMMRNFDKAGIRPSEADSIMKPLSFAASHRAKNGTMERSPDFLMILSASLIFASLLYLTIILYGQAVGRSVLQEKTDKTVEILLSSVHPLDILFGKILGNAAAGLLQYGIWIASSAFLLKLIGPRFGFTAGIVLTAGTYMYLVLYFILAYLLYCSIYATLGAASRDEQQLAQLSWPIIVCLTIPVMLTTAIIASPHAPIVFVLSIFPLTAPIVMFIRILLGAVTGIEIIVSVLLMLAAITGCLLVSTKIFSDCILLNGKR